MILSLIMPFIRAFKGLIWHDTFSLVVPPLGERYVPFDYYAGYRPSIIFYIYPGEVRLYDPVTGTIGESLRTADAGFVHEHPEYMLKHNDPFVESFLKHNPYEFVAWLAPGKPHRLWIYNRTANFIWTDVTIWIAEFPKEKEIIDGVEVSLEEAFNRYLRGIFKFFYDQGKH